MVEKVKINFCGISEFMKLPGVGRRIAGSLIKLRSREGNLTIDSLDWVRKLRVTPQLLSSIDFTHQDLVGESLGPEGENISGGDTVDTHLVGNQGESEAANPVSVDQTRWIDSMSTFIAQCSNPQQRELGLPRGRSDSDTRSSVVHHYPLQAPRNSTMLSRSSHVQSRPRPRTPVMSESDMINPPAPGAYDDTFREGSSITIPHPVHSENRTRSVPHVNTDRTVDRDHTIQSGSFSHPVHWENRSHPVVGENRSRSGPQVNPERIVDPDHTIQSGSFSHPVHLETRTRSISHVPQDQALNPNLTMQSHGFPHTSVVSSLPSAHPAANSSPGGSHRGGPLITSHAGIQFVTPAQTGCRVRGTDSSAVSHPHTAYPTHYGPQLSVVAPPNSGYHTIQPMNQAIVAPVLLPPQQGNMGMGGNPLSVESFTGIPASQGISVSSVAQPQMSFPPPLGNLGTREGPQPTYPSLSNNRFPVPGMPYTGYPPAGVNSDSQTQYPETEPLFRNPANNDNGSNRHQSRSNGWSSNSSRGPRRNAAGVSASFNDFSDDDSQERQVNKNDHRSCRSELSDDKVEDSYRPPNRLTRDRGANPSSSPRGFRPASLPKALTFDGKTSWASFKRKFKTYAEASSWSENEKNHAMCWSLTGKAADYYALLTERDAQIDYSTLMDRMERRLGARELPETSYARFASAQQRENEELEDWADRVLTLANRAFKDLPESHMNRQAIIKLCQGCADREAGQNACNARPTSMQGAMETIRWYQFTSQSMFGSKGSKVKQRAVSVSPDREETPLHVAAVKTETMNGSWNKTSANRQGPSQTVSGSGQGGWSGTGDGQRVSSPSPRQNTYDQRITALESGISKVQQGMEKMATAIQTINVRRPRSPSPGASGCFHCGDSSHFRRDCPKLSGNQDGKHVSFKDDLNIRGSEHERA